MNNFRHLSYNALIFIPTEIALCQNLRILKIWHNNLLGPVSPVILSLPDLYLGFDMGEELTKSTYGIKIYRRMLMKGTIIAP